MNTSTLDQYVHIYRALERRELEHDQFVGWLQLDATVCDQLKELSEKDLTPGTYSARVGGIDGTDLDSLPLDSVDERHFTQDVWIKVEIAARNIRHECSIYSNWSDLLSFPSNLSDPVQRVFFVGDGTGDGHLLDLDSGDDKFTNYQGVHKVYQLIKSLAEQTDGGDNTIFYERALTFQYQLTEDDLAHSIDIEAIEKLLEKDLHKEAINYLICGELVSFLKDIETSKRFSHLIQHLSSLVSNVLLSYQGYVENYTFDKVRKEYLEKKTGYIKSIHDTFDAIALKLLSLPAGIWFATSQIKASTVGEMAFTKNVVVSVTVFLLVVILVLNIWGQFSVLKALNKEYTEVFKQLAKSFEKEGMDIKDVQDELASAETLVQIKLWASILASVALLFMTLWLFVVAYK